MNAVARVPSLTWGGRGFWENAAARAAYAPAPVPVDTMPSETASSRREYVRTLSANAVW